MKQTYLDTRGGSAHRVAVWGLLVGVSLVLGYLESLIPFGIGVPGVKLGLCHIVTLFALYRMSTGAVWITGAVRVTLASLLFGNVMVLVYSGAGMVCSLCVMLLLRRCKCFSAVGVSVAGGAAHNVGQMLCAAALMQTAGLLWYLPVLLLAGTVSGTLTGLLGGVLISRYKTGGADKPSPQ